MLLGMINTVVNGFAFAPFYAIGRTRTGSVIAIESLISQLSVGYMIMIMGVIVISVLMAFFIGIFLAGIFAKIITKLKYYKISLGILIFLSLFVLLFSGLLGFLIFGVASFTGLVAILVGVRRAHLMGALMVPTIIFYLPF